MDLNRRVSTLAALAPVELSVSYCVTDRKHHDYQIESHSHDCCEIYVNVTGDVSFMVEDTLYPVEHGDVILTKPWERHHCVYRSDRSHEHYWLLFSQDGNEGLFPAFLNREAGKDNRIVLQTEKKEQLIALCRSLYENRADELKKIADFWMLQSLLSEGAAHTAASELLPSELAAMLAGVRRALPQVLSVEQLAFMGHVSVSTCERLFRRYTGLAPSQYMLVKRLERARYLLESGKTVTEAALECGFCDSSYFILQFRKQFGVTPGAYRRQSSK